MKAEKVVVAILTVVIGFFTWKAWNGIEKIERRAQLAKGANQP